MTENSHSFGSEIIKFYNLKPQISKKDKFKKIYQLPLQPRYRDEEMKLRICQFGNSNKDSKQINILVIGETGSGKSTVTNALINYLANVRYEDDHRLEIVSLEESERTGQEAGQTESQTDWITVYEICEMVTGKQKLQVNIVDTPGFGDTRGKERDEETFSQIKDLFKYGLTTVHAVCIAVHGTETRSHERQKYIFDSIMKLFGKDITKNLFIWATFTDDDNPLVLASIKKHGIQYEDHFSFENGALFRKLPETEREITKYKGKFEDVYETFDVFFDKIKNVSPLSLENSQQVLEERKKLQTHQAKIEMNIRKTLNCLEDQKIFDSNVLASDKKVVDSRNCFFDVTLTDRCGGNVFNCEDCKITCCDPCNHSIFDRFFYECANLSWGGYCNKCRCHSSRHEYSKFKRYIIKKKSLSEIEDLQMNDPSTIILDAEKQKLIEKAKYFVDFAQKDKQKTQEVLDQTKDEIKKLENHLCENLMTLHKAIITLQKIALYQEKTTVTEILKQIEDNDSNKNHPDAVKIYQKLNEFVQKNCLVSKK